MAKKFETEATELEQKYEERLSSQYESLTLKHRMETTEVEERKNAQIATLIKNHENAFTEMKNYYNDITLNNLSLIKSMKVSRFERYRQNEATRKAVKRKKEKKEKKRKIEATQRFFQTGTNGRDKEQRGAHEEASAGTDSGEGEMFDGAEGRTEEHVRARPSIDKLREE